MKKSKCYDREILSTPKNLDYMVQAVKGTLDHKKRESLFKCRNDTELFKALWSTPSAIDVLLLEEEFEKKSEELARKARERGNEYFKNKSYISALHEYNKSIIHAPLGSGGKKEDAYENVVPEDSTELSLAYGNRSAALFQLGKYEECLQDIQRALRLDYPNQSKHKLLHRQGSCYVKLKQFDKAKHSFDLSKESLDEQNIIIDEKMRNSWRKTLEKCIADLLNEEGSTGNKNIQNNSEKTSYLTVPSLKSGDCKDGSEASSLLHFKKDARNQDVVLAADEIDIGDVLIVEKPYANVLFPARMKKQKCYNCFATLPPNPVPCYDCTSVVYCNETCRDFSYDKFHRFECHYFALFGEDTCADVGHLVVRIFMALGVKRVLTYLKQYKNNFAKDHEGMEKEQDCNSDKESPQLNDQINMVLEEDNCHCSVFKLPVSGNRKPSPLNNDELIPLMELPFFACFLFKLLYLTGFLQLPSNVAAKYMPPKNDNATKLEVILEEIEDEDENYEIKDDNDLFLVGGFLVHCLRVVRRFGKLIREAKKFGDNPDELTSSVLGMALYPNSVSKVSHSCDPTADIVHYNDVAVIRSIRKLRKGDEISISFGPLFHEMKIEPRRKLLWRANSLACNCIACYNKWPVLEEMFDEVPSYRCENCLSVLVASDKTDGKFLVCPVCVHRKNLEEIVEKLRTSFDEYALAMNDAMSGDHEGALPRLCNHLQLIQKHIRQPWPDLVACQTAVKLCYRLMANRAET